MRWAGHVACVGEMRVLVDNPEGKPPLGRPRHKWEGNIKMALQKVGLRSMDWINLTQNYGRVVGSCECSNESLHGVS